MHFDPRLRDCSFRSDDERFGLTIRGNEFEKILEYCVEAGGLETGGILVGSYSENHKVALVWNASGPPRDSKSGATWFHRGIQGVQTWLRKLWNKNHYYLGEWHFHPGGKPIPSDTDVRQIKEISDSPGYRCPEPVLIIIGGSPLGQWEIGVYVSPRNRALVKLREFTNSGTSPAHQ